MKTKLVILLMLSFAIPVGAQSNSGALPFENPAAELVSSARIREVGIYAVSKNTVREVQSEIVEVRRSAIFGLDGRIANSRSQLRLAKPQEFVIRAPEGYSAAEYRLLKLEMKKDHRQFRALTMRIGGARDDGNKNALPFTTERISDHTWSVRLNLDKGEYAFFSPQIHSEGLGKSLTYTFGVDIGSEEIMPPPAVGDTAVSAVQLLRNEGALLGISGRDWEQGGAFGVEVLAVSGESAAETAGLHIGDVIVAVNGEKVHSAQDLASLTKRLEPGNTVTILYLFKSQLGWMPKTAEAVLPKSE